MRRCIERVGVKKLAHDLKLSPSLLVRELSDLLGEVSRRMDDDEQISPEEADKIRHE